MVLQRNEVLCSSIRKPKTGRIAAKRGLSFYSAPLFATIRSVYSFVIVEKRTSFRSYSYSAETFCALKICFSFTWYVSDPKRPSCRNWSYFTSSQAANPVTSGLTGDSLLLGICSWKIHWKWDSTCSLCYFFLSLLEIGRFFKMLFELTDALKIELKCSETVKRMWTILPTHCIGNTHLWWKSLIYLVWSYSLSNITSVIFILITLKRVL